MTAQKTARERRLYARVSKIVRADAQAPGSPYPIEVIAGAVSCWLTGKSWYYVNASGDIVRHPNAYRRAWGKPIYVGSTKRIVVGIDWLRVQADLAQEQEREKDAEALLWFVGQHAHLLPSAPTVATA